MPPPLPPTKKPSTSKRPAPQTKNQPPPAKKVWGYGPQDVGRTIGGGPAHKIKACTALLGMHRKTLYSTKYDTLLVTLSLQTI